MVWCRFTTARSGLYLTWVLLAGTDLLISIHLLIRFVSFAQNYGFSATLHIVAPTMVISLSVCGRCLNFESQSPERYDSCARHTNTSARMPDTKEMAPKPSQMTKDQVDQ